MAVEVREVNGKELDQLVAQGKVLVDFYSKTCGPCKMLGFVLKDVAKSVDGVKIVTVDFDTNKETVEHNVIEPHAKDENVLVFKDLQKLQSVGLVVPVDSEYMYFAAMESKACRLTALGNHYWRLVKDKS